MGAVGTFNYAAWAARFPEFGYINREVAADFFNEAAVFWRNDGTGPVTLATTQTSILYYVTAHLVKLFGPGPDGAGPEGIVGRISNATEGSVSVQAEYEVGNQQQFWSQTRYGDAFWQLTRVYRTFRYRVGPTRSPDPLWARLGAGWPFR